jgi:hypothetical protein
VRTRFVVVRHVLEKFRSTNTGRIALLDQVHRIDASTLAGLQCLAQDRELPLPDGTRLVRADRFAQLAGRLGLDPADTAAMAAHGGEVGVAELRERRESTNAVMEAARRESRSDSSPRRGRERERAEARATDSDG